MKEMKVMGKLGNGEMGKIRKNWSIKGTFSSQYG
jgi:hypothetical protein